MFPVYAGVILGMIVMIMLMTSVPRVCGGDPDVLVATIDPCLCSPCMRG